MFNKKTLRDIPKEELHGKRVFVRVDNIRKLAARKTKEGEETIEVSEEISDLES